ncbi:hypothetical protein A3Q56_08205 [Intoshia linei]|uniref:VWFA domain-containing protein n=1 Tax=Intoshia linei TaxID=1819745 RepID=A0A177AQ27_9BILA|nr:hypothetical protein A3Q56_08205 [Intoshia linei]
MVMYGDKSDLMFDFEQYSIPQDMIEFLRISNLEEGTNSYLAFKLMNDKLLNSPSSNDRVVIFMTNTKSSKKTDSVISESDKSKIFGAEIFSVGIGWLYNLDELKAIASIEDDLHVKLINDYSIESAHKYAENVLKIYC